MNESPYKVSRNIQFYLDKNRQGTALIFGRYTFSNFTIRENELSMDQVYAFCGGIEFEVD